MVSTRCQW